MLPPVRVKAGQVIDARFHVGNRSAPHIPLTAMLEEVLEEEKKVPGIGVQVGKVHRWDRNTGVCAEVVIEGELARIETEIVDLQPVPVVDGCGFHEQGARALRIGDLVEVEMN